MSFFRKNATIGLAELICRAPLVFTVGYLARSIGADNYGNWALVVAFHVFVASFAGLGLSSSLSRFVPVCSGEEAWAYLRFAFAQCLGVIALAGAATFVLKAPLGALLGVKAEFYWLLPVAALMAAGSVADGLLDAFFKGRMVVGRQICFIAARTLVEIVAVVLVFVVALPSLGSAPLQLAAYVGAVVFGKLAIYPIILAGMTTRGPLPPQDRRVEFLKYGLPMVPTVVAVWLVSQSDRLVLSHFVAKSDLGVYAFGASLAAYTVFLGYAIYPLLLPAASRLHDNGNAPAVQALFQSSQKLFIVLWAGGMACLALWSAQIIVWTGGAAFAGAGKVLLILSFAVGFEHLMGVYQYVFHLVKRTDLIFWLNLGYAALMMSALAIAGYSYGIVAAPWAVLAATLIFSAVRYRIALRYVLIPLPDLLIVQVAALGVLIALLAHYAADWPVSLRLTITAAILLPLGGIVLRHKADPSFGNLS